MQLNEKSAESAIEAVTIDSSWEDVVRMPYRYKCAAGQYRRVVMDKLKKEDSFAEYREAVKKREDERKNCYGLRSTFAR